MAAQPSDHGFRVFDFCFNFDFFREHPEGIETGGGVPLRARLFQSRVREPVSGDAESLSLAEAEATNHRQRGRTALAA